MKGIILGFITAFVAHGAQAADMSLSVNLGGVMDLPDKVSAEHTKFNVGPALGVTYRLHFTQAARLRVGLHSYFATGSDRVSWELEIDGEKARVYDDDHFSMVVGVAGTVGFDVMVPGDLPIRPYLGTDVGGAWVGTYHSFGGDTQLLLDPNQNELDNSSNVDPYTGQFAWLTELHLGAEKTFGDRVSLQLELGYQMAYLGASPLKKTPEAIKAQREAYGWNALDLSLGLGFSF